MKKCVLYISPEGRTNYIHDTFKNSDVYYVTYGKEDKNALSFNKGKNWIYNRNYLAEHIERKYDYYVFIDYDVIFDIDQNNVEATVDKYLNEYNPAIMTPVNARKEKVIPGLVSNNTQSNNHIKIVHHSLVDYFFPMLDQFGGFWDGAIFFNLLAIPFRKNVIHVHDLPCRGLVSAPYYTSSKVGMDAMTKMYEWMKPAFGPKWPYKDRFDMNEKENLNKPNIGVSKNVNNSNYIMDKNLIDVSHPIFNYRNK
jgi:hypothetical protein